MENDRDRILVVDDEPELRKSMAAGLEAQSYEVYAAANGEEALRLAAISPPDVVILDLMMLVLDGIETCRRLRA